MRDQVTGSSGSRYEKFSDADLLSFVREGEENFIPDAWRELTREVEQRHLDLSATAPEPTSQTTGDVRSDAPVGLGGWLAVFQVYVVFGIVTGLVAMVVAGAVVQFLLVASAWEATLIVGLLLMYAREPLVRHYWMATLGLWAIAVYVGAILRGVSPFVALLAPLVPAIWIDYWARSARVRATFGNRAASTALSASPAPGGPSGRD